MPTTHRRNKCYTQKPQRVREAKVLCLRQATLQYPSLHFEAHAIKGQANQIAHPIYLPALAIGPDSAKQVGGNEDVILTLPGLEGFQMKIKANSVTFPDGSRQGLLVISPVTADKLPMAPPAGGAQFGVPAWTIQPSGTRFDPPIEVHMPNATGEIAGDNLPVVQWDHDLSQYVPMGRATVSGDGAILITDAGSGITKAGWGGLCRYDECKTSLPKEGCGLCKKVEYKGRPPCPECVFDKTNTQNPGAEISRPFQYVLGGWGPSKALQELATKALGVDITLQLSAVGQKTEKLECCERTERPERVLAAQVGLQGEAAAEISLNRLGGLVGRALSVAGLKAAVRGKVAAQVTGSIEFKDCEFPDESANFNGQGQFGGGLELVIKVGELSTGSGNFTAVGFEGSGGIEVQGVLTPDLRLPKNPNFKVDSFLNAYVQGDTIFLNQKITGIRLQIPLMYNGVAPAKVLFP